jgi:hypothetical protein
LEDRERHGPSIQHRTTLDKWTSLYPHWAHTGPPSGCTSGQARGIQELGAKAYRQKNPHLTEKSAIRQTSVAPLERSWGGYNRSGHEEAIRAFFQAAVTAEKEYWTSAQVENVLSHLAPEARYHVFAWQETFLGHDAIREELLRQWPLFSVVRLST